MLHYKLTFVFFIFVNISLNAQELFPLNEPASTIPKGVLGFRLSSQIHYNKAEHREMIRLMYGLHAKVTTMLTATFSNFHIKEFPRDLNAYYKIYHNHKANEVNYPYSFEGVHVLTKWRFLSFDHKNEHLRFTLYNELSYSNVTHLDAFPSLMGDQSGIAFGLIATKLYKKLAVSLTGSYTDFLPYYRNEGLERIKFKAGNSMDINFSVGYLVWPRTYKSYKDLNINLYVEVLDKYYSLATISRNGNSVNTEQFEYLKGDGNLVYFCPGIQFIINSRTRIDLVTQQGVHRNNNINQYSMFRINLQHYIY